MSFMKSLGIAAIALLPLAAQAEIKGYRCVGTEPFYNLNVNGNHLTLTFPIDEIAESFSVAGPISAVGTTEGYVSVYKSKEKDAVLSILMGSCNDGMSDKEYPYSMIFVKDSLVLTGCCERLH